MRARPYHLGGNLRSRNAYPWREEGSVGECDVALRLLTLSC